MSQVRVKLKYQGRIIVGDPAQDPWLIWDLDEQTEQEQTEEEKSEHEIQWRVLLVAPDLEELPVVLIKRDDAHFLEDDTEIPASLSSELDRACTGEELLSPESPEEELDQVKEQDPDEVKENERLIEQYLALPKEEPRLALDSVAWFHRAIERKLFGSLTLFDDLRPPSFDPLPVGNGYPNWDLGRHKSAGWVARSFIQQGVSTLYETPNALKFSPPRGRKLILSGSTLRRTSLSTYIRIGPGPPFAPPFVVRAAETK